MEDKGGEANESNETPHEEENDENSDNVAQTVGHNMYILAYQVRYVERERVSEPHSISLCFHIEQQMEKHAQVPLSFRSHQDESSEHSEHVHQNHSVFVHCFPRSTFFPGLFRDSWNMFKSKD